MALPYDGDIAAAAQLIEFMGGVVEAAALSTSASFFADCCMRNAWNIADIGKAGSMYFHWTRAFTRPIWDVA